MEHKAAASRLRKEQPMRERVKAVTIKDVAEAAGVNRSTVSRAFTRPDLIRPETTAHILAVARKLGYSPNHTARALSTGKPANIALIVPDLVNPFIPQVISAVQHAADGENHCVFIGNADEDAATESRLLSRFVGQVSGAIIVAARSSESQLRRFEAEMPVVLINRDVSGMSRVLVDSTLGMAEAVQHLIGLGHRRICYLAAGNERWSDANRRAAVSQACHDAGVDLTILAAAEVSFAGGRACAAQVASGGVTGVIAFDDLLAQGLLAGLAEAGIRVPDDLSLIGCDDLLGAVTYPALTSISGRAKDVGRLGVELLFQRLRSEGGLDARLGLSTQLVLRATTAAAR